MSNLTSASGEASANSSANIIENFSAQQTQTHDEAPSKKRRNLPGNPDPEAEVIALSPKTLMATNRFICEICKKGFQREQNLQLHRRGHNLPWKLKQRTNNEIIRKKVYVCPEATCVHHEASRALGDLTGIKKHFSRKHGEKKWKCEKCSKKYAVQSDWKAHSKTCGTREYKCDCGTLFSRRDSFITHRAFCDALAEESSNSKGLMNQVLPLKKEHENINFLIREQEIEIPCWLGESLSIHENPNPRNTLPSSSSSSPHMSATALLQKAAQMGAKTSSQSQTFISGTHQHGHVSLVDFVKNNNNNMVTSNVNFGLSMCEEEEEEMILNDHHAFIINSFTSFNEDAFAGNILNSKNDNGGSDGFTRDFLGLKPLSHSDIVLMENCIKSSSSSSSHHQQKPSQGMAHLETKALQPQLDAPDTN
ncbi:protein indeterminate-domain 7-like isoform X2 [Cicer arietinum]|uniref:protein indeterminate-domain 7-like isoform X2 n=1 Tax=Cicer arietinum TaxID=3827 RepID=UPI00032A9579